MDAIAPCRTLVVAAASRHGGTCEIADRLAWVLENDLPLGWRVVRPDLSDLRVFDDADAVVLGSAIYMGNWLPEARQFVTRHASALRGRPVWLFSSGPLGADDPQPTGDPAQLDELMTMTGAREHRIFVGKLDKHQLGFGERLAVKMVKAPDGDFRDWDAICVWAREIGAALQPEAVLAAP